MERIIFATNNENKVEEVKSIIGSAFTIVSLREAGIDIEIPEPHATLEQNAKEKSTSIFKLTRENCFGEDTGLEIEALNGEPGVKSARYAGDDKRTADNIKKVLKKLEGIKERKARFRTVISLIFKEVEYKFEGICEGEITEVVKGSLGFGYDSIFIPNGSNKTFAEMTLFEKNIYSHRKKATAKLASFLSLFGKG